MNYKTPHELNLEARIKDLERELAYLKSRSSKQIVVTPAGAEYDLPLDRPSLVSVAEVAARRDNLGYCVHARSMTRDGEYKAHYRADELAFKITDESYVINHVLPKMHETFLHQLAHHLRKNSTTRL